MSVGNKFEPYQETVCSCILLSSLVMTIPCHAGYNDSYLNVPAMFYSKNGKNAQCAFLTSTSTHYSFITINSLTFYIG